MIAACTHGMPTPASCVECMEDGPVGPPSKGPEQLLPAVRTTTARYDGRCPRCHDTFDAGDLIGWVEAIGGWCCSRCCA